MTRTIEKWMFPLCAALATGGCQDTAMMMMMTSPGAPAVSSPLALSADDSALWVVNPDADSISLVDPKARALLAEVALGKSPPSLDADGRYEPAILPRALALSTDGARVFIAAQFSGELIVVDAKTRAVTTRVPLPAEPVSVVASPDGKFVYIASFQAGVVSKVDTATLAVVATLPVGDKPWGLSITGDSRTLFVTSFLLDPGLRTVTTDGMMAVTSKLTLVDQPVSALSPKVPNGAVRGVYAAAIRPGDGQLWLPHLLLSTTTAQPQLAFDTTVFPTITTVTPDGKAEVKRLLFKPTMVPGASGSFTDSCSGPRAIAFTPDGKLALLALTNSEQVMVFDPTSGDELGIVSPQEGTTMIEGVVVDHAGKTAYVNGRNSHDVMVLALDPTNAASPAIATGPPVNLLANDPMPTELRLGQRLFYTANSAAFPITQNFWVACASCHLEGATDGVTWRFKEGPRDTPSNAGGPIHTGFLLHQALRSTVQQYDATIRDEQGGSFDRNDATQGPQLDALARYVNYAIPLPRNPNRAASGLTPSQQRGQATFAARCASCHSGDWYTDSGAGNPTLDVTGIVKLHDVGTCVTSGFVDQPAVTAVGDVTRAPCEFDTPTLRGVFATGPWFHDGSAMNLRDAVKQMVAANNGAPLSDGDETDLVNFVSGL